MKWKLFASIAILFFLCSCRTGMVITVDGPDWDTSRLEERSYDTAPDGEKVVRVAPKINSRDELLMYRELKKAEAAEILGMTEEASAENPYYPAVITLAKPLTIAEFNELISNYDPSIKKAMTAAGLPKATHLEKAEIVKDVDKIIASVIKFNSTTGKGQLHYETLADEQQLKQLESELAKQESEQNSIEDYELVKGITSFGGGVHRTDVMNLYDDPRVFIADIGPIDLYEGSVQFARWDDVSELVERYLNHQ
jgi:hypothetical protein